MQYPPPVGDNFTYLYEDSSEPYFSKCVTSRLMSLRKMPTPVDLCCLAQPMQTPPFFSGSSWSTTDEPDTASTFTCSSLLTSPDPDVYDEHNMWNPMLGLFCCVKIGVFLEAYVEEVDMGRTALSYHFLWMYYVRQSRDARSIRHHFHM